MAKCQQVSPLSKRCLIALMDVAWMNAGIGIAASQNAWFMMLAVKKCWARFFTTINSKHYCHIWFPPTACRAQGIARVNTVECAHRRAAQNHQMKMNGRSESFFYIFWAFCCFSFANRSHVLMWDWGEFCRSVLLHFCMLHVLASLHHHFCNMVQCFDVYHVVERTKRCWKHINFCFTFLAPVIAVMVRCYIPGTEARYCTSLFDRICVLHLYLIVCAFAAWDIPNRVLWFSQTAFGNANFTPTCPCGHPVTGLRRPQ